MQINEIMTKDVVSVTPDELIENVAKLLIKNRIHGVPVVEDGKVVGIITETDFFTKGTNTIYLPEYISCLRKDTMVGKMSCFEKDKVVALLNTTVKDIMSFPCTTIKGSDDISVFFKLARENKLKSVPVVDDKEVLIVIVTLSDVIDLINVE